MTDLLLGPRRSRWGRGARGASAVEYALLIAGVAAVIVVAVYLFGGSVQSLFSTTCTKLSSARSAGSSC